MDSRIFNPDIYRQNKRAPFQFNAYAERVHRTTSSCPLNKEEN